MPSPTVSPTHRKRGRVQQPNRVLHGSRADVHVSLSRGKILVSRQLLNRPRPRFPSSVMESFFSSVKSELVDRFDSCGEAKMELFDNIEVFYNQRCRHSTLGQISPAAFER